LKNGRVMDEGAPDWIFGPDAKEETKSFLSSF
jgi:ABC-type histidine transport system ATPase subunit